MSMPAYIIIAPIGQHHLEYHALDLKLAKFGMLMHNVAYMEVPADDIRVRDGNTAHLAESMANTLQFLGFDATHSTDISVSAVAAALHAMTVAPTLAPRDDWTF